MTGPGLRCGHAWTTKVHPGTPDEAEHRHICVRPPGTHGPTVLSPPILGLPNRIPGEHLCVCGETAPQENPAVA
jgi:hypothetical protein